MAIGVKLRADVTTLVTPSVAAAPAAAVRAAEDAWTAVSGMLQQLHREGPLHPGTADGGFPLLRITPAFRGMSLQALAEGVSREAKRGDDACKIRTVMTLAGCVAQVLDVFDECDISAFELAQAFGEVYADRHPVLRQCRRAHGF